MNVDISEQLSFTSSILSLQKALSDELPGVEKVEIHSIQANGKLLSIFRGHVDNLASSAIGQMAQEPLCFYPLVSEVEQFHCLGA